MKGTRENKKSEMSIGSNPNKITTILYKIKTNKKSGFLLRKKQSKNYVKIYEKANLLDVVRHII
jgi:hypothetical protein